MPSIYQSRHNADFELRRDLGMQGKNPGIEDPDDGKQPRAMPPLSRRAARELQDREETSSSLDPADTALSPLLVIKQAGIRPPPSPAFLEGDEKTEDCNDGPIAPNCQETISLSSRNIASLLTLLEHSPLQWPAGSLSRSSEEGSEAVTTVTSNLTGADSMERRPSTPELLLIEDTGPKMKEVNRNTGQALAEIVKLKRELEIVAKERDLLKERESQHVESLKILKQEVNSLTLAKVTSPADFSTELEQLRVENELFAAQIVESEVEMREIRTLLECLDAENSQMRKDLEAVRGKVVEDKLCQKSRLEPESTCESWSLASQVEILEARLQHLERLSESMNRTLEEERRLRQEETGGLKLLLHQTREMTESALSSCEGIEVTMGGVAADVENSHEERRGPTEKERTSLIGICDCCLFAKGDE